MSLQDFGEDMLTNSRRIAEQVARGAAQLRWATITSVLPLRIRYDGENEASIVTPESLAGALSTGDRVVVAKQDRQAIILDKPGGSGGGGQRGPGLEFHWDGTRLGVRVEGDNNYVYTDLEGPQGSQGVQGPKGDTGSQGPRGLQGDTGAKGDKGDKGDPGDDGSVWHRITTTNPANSLGKFGDWAIRDSNGNIWEKTGNNTWTARGTLKGPAGDVDNVSWDDLQDKPATFPPAAHTHDRVETTSTRWVGIAGNNQLSATTYAMAARSGVSQPDTAGNNAFPLVVARNDGSNEVRLERLTGTIHADYLPPWAVTNLQTYVATSFSTRDLMGYTDGRTVVIRGLLGGGNITQGGMDITRTAIPTSLRPGPGNWQGACWVNGGHPSLAFVREDGTISVVQRSGGNVTGAQFVVTYPRI